MNSIHSSVFLFPNRASFLQPANFSQEKKEVMMSCTQPLQADSFFHEIKRNPFNTVIIPRLAFGKLNVERPSGVLPTDVSQVKSAGTETLLPEGTPLFFVSGTFKDAKRTGSLPKYYRNYGQNPVYHAYLPEIEHGSGIHFLRPAKTSKLRCVPAEYPAYVMLLADLASFRSQLLYNKLTKLKDELGLNVNFADRQITSDQLDMDKIKSFFELPENFPNNILNVIANEMVIPMFILPERNSQLEKLGDGYVFYSMVTGIRKRLETEAVKILPKVELSELPEIIDTGFLQCGTEKLRFKKERPNPLARRMNYSTTNALNALVERTLSIDTKQSKQVQLRPVELERYASVELYLLYFRQRLSNALREPLAEYNQRKQDVENIEPEALTNYLLQRLCPPGSAIGHSQGGTVIHTALLEYLLHPKVRDLSQFKNYEDLTQNRKSGKGSSSELDQFSPPFPKALLLAGQYIGVSDYRSAPLSGIPENPAWAKPIGDIVSHIHRKYGIARNSLMMQAVIQEICSGIGWACFDQGRPGIQELRRRGSTLYPFFREHDGKFSEQLSQNYHGVTLQSLYNPIDMFIEPSATDITGNYPIEHIALNGLPHMPENSYPEVAEPLAILSRVLDDYGEEKIAEIIKRVSQHVATTSSPAFISPMLEKYYLEDWHHLNTLLQPGRFEPMQYQALKLATDAMKRDERAQARLIRDVNLRQQLPEDADILPILEPDKVRKTVIEGGDELLASITALANRTPAYQTRERKIIDDFIKARSALMGKHRHRVG